MVQPFQPGCRESATRADPRLVIDVDLPGLYPTDKDEGESPPVLDVSNNLSNVKHSLPLS
jgi:hypothetical protein